MGRSTDLQVDAAGNLNVLYYRFDDHTLKILSRTAGVWGAPQVIDNSGIVGGASSLAIDAAGNRKVGYSRVEAGVSSLYYAGAEIPRTWSAAAIAQAGDVGQSLRLVVSPSGDIGVGYQNLTAGSLQMIQRSGGVWGSPFTVDPGPSRGRYLDITYRNGSGYLFSEFASLDLALILADPTLQGRSFAIQQATSDADDVGRPLALWTDADGSLTAAYRNQTRGSLQYVRRTGGSWTTPVTVDPGPSRAQYLDITYRAGAGYSFTEFSNPDIALLLLDPTLHAPPFNVSQVTNSEDNVGPGLSLVSAPDGVLAASYRDLTEGKLWHIRRVQGVWTTPVLVDGGLNRGQYSDLTRTPDGGYCFSEYDPGQISLLLAHATLQGRPFATHRVDALLPAGKQVSLFTNPAGRLDCVYLTEQTGGRLQLNAAEIAPTGAYTIRTVADSVSMTANGLVTPDVCVTANHGWYISYSKIGPNDLYMASTDNFELLPADAPDENATATDARSFLKDAYPNPSPAGFRVRFSSAADAAGEMTLYDPQGRRVRRIEMHCRMGENTVAFDGKSDSGSPLGRGVYFLSVRVGSHELGKLKIVLLDTQR